MPPSPRQSGSTAFPPARAGMNSVPVYEVIKTRTLVKLQERFDPAKARRMPASLYQQAARQQIEQIVEAEAHRLNRADRDRMIEDVFGEMFGFGPLEELFADAGVQEFTVLGPHVVIAQRGQGWVPTNVKFRDDEQLYELVQKLATRGEAVGDPLRASVLDVKLSNGFRAIAVVPPPAIGVPPTVTFVRAGVGTRTPTPAIPTAPSGTVPHAVLDTAGGGTRTPQPASAQSSTGSGRVGVPTPRPAARLPVPGEYPLERHRVRITERLIAKMASIGMYDLSRVDTNELRKVVAAYVDEHCQVEKIFLNDTEKGRLTLEILTGMNR